MRGCFCGRKRDSDALRQSLSQFRDLSRECLLGWYHMARQAQCHTISEHYERHSTADPACHRRCDPMNVRYEMKKLVHDAVDETQYPTGLRVDRFVISITAAFT